MVEDSTFSTHQPIVCTTCIKFYDQVLSFCFKQVVIVYNVGCIVVNY